jgi:RNA polymerase sigma-70 factor, ECF subfamily
VISAAQPWTWRRQARPPSTWRRWPGALLFPLASCIRQRDEAPLPASPTPGRSSLVPATGRMTGAQHGPSCLSEFDAFFTLHEQPLYGYLRRLLPTDDTASELTQETFFRAWRSFPEVQAYERPAAWLYRVATNLAISHLRRQRAVPLSQMTGAAGAGDVADDEFLTDPSDFAGQNAERDLISQVLRRLPERQRAALLLRAVHGFSCEEVARALDMSPATARQTLSRGRARFRALLCGRPARERAAPRSPPRSVSSPASDLSQESTHVQEPKRSAQRHRP